MKKISFDEVQPIINLYTVWSGRPEIGWFCKAWKSLDAAGLTSFFNDVDRHWVFIRAVALGAMYGDYCDLEWDEYFEDAGTIDSLWECKQFNPIRIGAMAAAEIDPNESDFRSMFATAINALVYEVRLEVYDALLVGFGNAIILYAGLWGSRSSETDFDDLEQLADELFDESHSLAKGRFEAFSYVVSASMFAKDA